jgi:hypothetical protein
MYVNFMRNTLKERTPTWISQEKEVVFISKRRYRGGN